MRKNDMVIKMQALQKKGMQKIRKYSKLYGAVGNLPPVSSEMSAPLPLAPPRVVGTWILPQSGDSLPGPTETRHLE